MRQSITAWLSSPDDYETGLELLRSTGFSGFLLGVLAAGENAYNRTRLEAELRTWLSKQENVSVASSADRPEATRYAEQSAVTMAMDFAAPDTVIVLDQADGVLHVSKPAQLSEGIAHIRKRKGDLHNERQELKATLRAKMDDNNSDTLMAERLPLAIRIKQITRELDELYSQDDFYEEHGYLPPAAKDAAVELDDSAQLMNVRTYVSRYKNELKNPKLKPAQRQRKQELLLTYTQEKQRLEIKLGLNPPTDPVTP